MGKRVFKISGLCLQLNLISLGESDMFRGMDTKKSCGIWFG